MDLKRRFRNLYASLQLYRSALASVIKYQLVSKLIFTLLISILRFLALRLIYSTGRVAVSSGDFRFVFQSWQGILLLLFALISLFLYVAFDINIQIVYAEKLLKNEDKALYKSFKEGIYAIRRYFSLPGILIIIYIALLTPLVGFGLTISLTRNLYIPAFITAVIKDRFLYTLLYYLVLIIFGLIGFFNLFVLYGIAIDDLTARQAIVLSSRLVKDNFKDYLLQNVAYYLLLGLIDGAIVVITLIVPIIMAGLLSKTYLQLRLTVIIVSLLCVVLLSVSSSLSQTYYIIRMCELYFRYRKIPYQLERKATDTSYLVLILIILITGVLVAGSYINANFEEIFIRKNETQIIAHRGGGDESAENSLSGLKAAIDLGVYGSEIDVQRSKDGHYIVYHDATFRKLGDKRRVEELTLEEIRELKLGNGETVPTLEEILDLSKDKLKLFIEMKGNSADRKMADEIIAMIEERKMSEQCALISLKYELIAYAEKKYPAIDTGYLTFVTFGDTASSTCDYLGLEEEATSRDAIEAIHEQDKKVLVWTANDEDSQRYFLISGVDGIITDRIKEAVELKEALKNRSDFEIIFDAILAG